MSQDPPLSPTASGRLSATPLPELLVKSLERRLSGSFVLTAPARRERVLVVASGRVVKVRPPEPVEPLASVDRTTPERVASERLGRRLVEVARLPEETAFAFFQDIDLLDDEPEHAADPLSLIWRCLREGAAPMQRQ